MNLHKNEKMGLAQTYIPLNFETDLDHHLGTKISKIWLFPIYLSLRALAEVRAEWFKMYWDAVFLSTKKPTKQQKKKKKKKKKKLF